MNKREKREEGEGKDHYSASEEDEEMYEYDYVEDGKPSEEHEEPVETHTNNKRKCEIYLKYNFYIDIKICQVI